MEENVEKIMRKYVKKGDPLLVGVSGGVDSMVLMYILASLGYESLHIVHMNHGIRDDAQEDALLVKTHAKKLGYSFDVCEKDITSSATLLHENVENLGRKERYTFFETMRKKYGAKLILTAHHKDDRYETQLMHLFRGCALKGARGMKIYDERKNLLRPLLLSTKHEIHSYAKKLCIPWREDVTNEDTSLQRNELRRVSIPMMKSEIPRLEYYLDSLESSATNLEKILEEMVEHFLGCEAYILPFTFSVEIFKHIPKEVLRYWFVELFQRYDGSFYYTSDHLMVLEEKIRHLSSGKKVEFSPRIEIIQTFQECTVRLVSSEPKKIFLKKEILVPYMKDMNMETLEICWNNPSEDAVLLETSLVNEGIILRGPLPGDKVRLVHGNHVFHKNLKKFFVEKKVPSEERRKSNLVVSVATGEIIGMIGMKSFVQNSHLPCVLFTIRHVQ